MQTEQYVFYLVMVYGTSFLFIYLVESIYERLTFAGTSYRNIIGGLLVGMVAPFIQWVIQGVNHPAMPPTLPDGRFMVIMLGTVYYGAQGGVAAMVMVWAGSLFMGYPQIAFLFVHGIWLYLLGLVMLRLSLKLPYSRHILLIMGGTAVNQIGSIPSVAFLVLSGPMHTYFRSLPFVFVALEFYTVAISFIFIHNRQRRERILNLKLSEQRIGESEKKFSTVFHASPVSIGLTRLSDNTIVDVNDAFLRIFGFVREEVIGRTSYELNLWVRPDERSDWLNMLRGRDKHLETQFQTKSGEIKDVLIFAEFMAVGGEQYVLYLIDDITVRKRTEIALTEARKYLDKIINSIGDPLFVKDRKHRWVLVNQALCNLTGHSREEILGKSDYDYFPKEEADIFWEKDEVVFTSGKENINEEPITDANGNIHIIVTKKTPFTDDIGEQFLVAVIRDITDRKRVEEALLESETQYRNLIESSLVGVYIIQDNLFKFVNRRFSEMVGYTFEEIVNKIGPIELTHPDDRISVEDNIRRRMSGEIEYVEQEIKIVSKDGKVISAKILGRRMTYNGRPAIMGTVIDITEQKRSEEDKARLEAQLAQAQRMESIGTLAGGIAHDFNNILSAIIGFAHLALIDISEPAKAKGELEEVLKASDRAKDLVHQILTFSRKTENAYSPLSLPPLLKESLKMLRSVIPTTIEIRQDLIESGLVMSDPTQIHQLVMNLSINAAQAMDKTGGALSVSLKRVALDVTTAWGLEVAPGTYLQLTVSDNGPGMSAEVLNRIFEPYFTTKELGRGTGLGLSVVHGIVKSHGGAITCKSTAGKGTTFDVYLPEIEIEVEERQPENGESIPRGTERILFIDDEQMLANVTVKILGMLGYEVMAKTDGFEALEFFKANSDTVDLVITDMTMPGITGDKLAQRMMEIRPNIPIILCTGYSEHITRETAKDLGIREYILKPLAIEKLARTIRNILD